MGERRREIVLIALWESEAQPKKHAHPVMSGVRGNIDYLCPVCRTIVFADISAGQVLPGDKVFCPGCQTACEVPPLTDAAEGDDLM